MELLDREEVSNFLKRKNGIYSCFLCIVSGGLFALCQPPFNLGHLSWFCLVPFLIGLNGKKAKQGFVYGFIMGAVYFLCILYFVFIVQPPLTITGAILLIIYQALYLALFGLLFSIIAGRDSCLQFVFSSAFLWVSIEYLRSIGVMGFPWGLLAYTQWKNLTLIQIAEITGVYGVSFVVFVFNAAVAYIILQYLRKPFDYRRFSTPEMAVLSVLLIGIITSVFFYGMRAISRYEPLIKEREKEIDIAIVQGNIDQSKKWDPHYLGESLGVFMGLTGELKGTPDLIIWPETAITVSLNENPFLRDSISGFARSIHTYLITGVQEYEDGRYYNRAILISPAGEISGKYDKIHLVPFGEATPAFFKWIFPFLKKVIPGEDISSGSVRTVFEHPSGKFSCCICFESIFPGEIRLFIKRGAQFLVNITNDAWFGKTNAPYHHFAINVFRAVENRIEIARAANSGISGYIDKLGRPRYYTRIFTRGLIRSNLSLRNGTTIYTRFGDIFSYACLVATALLMSLPFLKAISQKS